MAMQIPDYAVFAQMPVDNRRQSLNIIQRFAGQHAATLFLQVYQFDPDAGLREMARETLRGWGITPPTDPTPMNIPESGGIAMGVTDSMPDIQTRQASYSFTSSSTQFADTSNLTGGSGRPIQRGPQHANVFTLYRNHRKYLTGEVNHIPHSLFGYLLTVGIFAVVLIVMYFGFSAASNATNVSSDILIGDSIETTFKFAFWGVAAVFGLITFIMFWVWRWNVGKNRRYEREATLLLGQVVASGGEWRTSTDSEGSTSRNYYVTVQYRVRTPDGRTFDNKDTTTRKDLANSVLPQTGAPVAVMVIDGENMRLL